MSAWEELSGNFCGLFKSTWKEHSHNHFGACVVLYCTERRERTESQSLWKEQSHSVWKEPSHNLYGKNCFTSFIQFMERTQSQSLWEELFHKLYRKNRVIIFVERTESQS